MSKRRISLFTLAIAVTALLTACSSSKSSASPSSALPTQTLTAGAISVKVAPTRLDEKGATFSISLDTHSADLSLDLTTAAVLRVGSTDWTVDGWTGDGPGGHHREGQLRFTANGPPRGTATLTISGLPTPVEATWELGAA